MKWGSILKKGITLIILLITCLLLITVYRSENQKKEMETLNQQLKISNEKLQEAEELYYLRNILDYNLYNILGSLIKGDSVFAKENFAPNVKISDKKLISELNGIESEFLIPDRTMKLRQRAYMLQGDKYMAIYEIYDAGYNQGNKYDDRLWTLNVNYIKVNSNWKLSYIKIDE
jgi:hypothetical protein